jgi:hypothetical protein
MDKLPRTQIQTIMIKNADYPKGKENVQNQIMRFFMELEVNNREI